jgi:hypothetical protein
VACDIWTFHSQDLQRIKQSHWLKQLDYLAQTSAARMQKQAEQNEFVRAAGEHITTESLIVTY